MSFPRYPEYKDSGVEWIGELPSHWDCEPLKYSTEIFTGNSLNDDEKAIYESDDIDAFPYVSSKDINATSRSINYENGLRIPVNKKEFKVAPRNSFLLCVEGGSAGKKIGILNQDVCFVNKLCCFNDNTNNRYKYYFAQSINFKDKFNLSVTGLIGGVSTSLLRSFSVPVPTSQEQWLIGTFLDHETSKIDSLITEQERLIELLKEKRQAVIAHAVTKGLDPNVKMKDSGVEWLGEVPEHWDVKYLRHIAKIVRGASPRPAGDPLFFDSENDYGENTPWVTVAEITKDDDIYLNSVNEYLTPLGVSASQFFELGTLIFSNSGATLGVPKILNIDCCANDGVLAFRKLSDNVHVEFLYFFLLTTTDRLRTEMKQGGGQPNLNTDIVKSIGLAVPSVNEQFAIVAFLKQEDQRFTSLMMEANSTIALLQERRSALISAAVTGQIDIRNFVQEAVPS